MDKTLARMVQQNCCRYPCYKIVVEAMNKWCFLQEPLLRSIKPDYIRQICKKEKIEIDGRDFVIKYIMIQIKLCLYNYDNKLFDS